MKIQSWIAAGLCLAGFSQLQGGTQVTGQKDTLNSRVITQVGIIVKDIDKMSKAWANLLGVEAPRWSLTDPLERSHAKYKGQPTTARAKLVFFDLGQVQLELIEPVGGPSAWKDFLDRNGEGVQHIAFLIKDMDGQIRVLERLGMPAIQRGDYTGGRYGYIDSNSKLGVMLELLENLPEKK